MRIVLCIITMFVSLTGCATSRNVTIGQITPIKAINTAALVSQEGNSPEMNSIVQEQLMLYGISPKLALPDGTRQSKDVDLIVAYSDVWHWDIAMYLRSISINFFEGPTGNLIATGRWDNSLFHGFQDPRDVVKELLDDMFAKLTVLK